MPLPFISFTLREEPEKKQLSFEDFTPLSGTLFGIHRREHYLDAPSFLFPSPHKKRQRLKENLTAAWKLKFFKERWLNKQTKVRIVFV